MKIFKIVKAILNEAKNIESLSKEILTSKKMLKKISFLSFGKGFKELDLESQEKVKKINKEWIDDIKFSLSNSDIAAPDRTLSFQYIVKNFLAPDGSPFISAGTSAYRTGIDLRDELIEKLEKYFLVKRYADEKNLFNINPKDLSDITDKAYEKRDKAYEKKGKKSKLINLLKSKSKFINLGEIDQFDVYIPQNMEAACLLGMGTKWCTAATDDNFARNRFLYYHEMDDLIIAIDKKTNEKYQLHKKTNSIMDSSDLPVSRRYEIYDKLTKILKQVKEKEEVIKLDLHKNISIPERFTEPFGKKRTSGVEEDFGPDANQINNLSFRGMSPDDHAFKNLFYDNKKEIILNIFKPIIKNLRNQEIENQKRVKQDLELEYRSMIRLMSVPRPAGVPIPNISNFNIYNIRREISRLQNFKDTLEILWKDEGRDRLRRGHPAALAGESHPSIPENMKPSLSNYYKQAIKVLQSFIKEHRNIQNRKNKLSQIKDVTLALEEDGTGERAAMLYFFDEDDLFERPERDNYIRLSIDQFKKYIWTPLIKIASNIPQHVWDSGDLDRDRQHSSAYWGGLWESMSAQALRPGVRAALYVAWLKTLRSPQERPTGWRKASLKGERVGKVCCWCGETPVGVEHIIPRGIGGPKFERWNLAWSCYLCNQARGGMIGPPPTRATRGWLARKFRQGPEVPTREELAKHLK